MITVAALFVRPDSIYKSMQDVDCWDIARDARKWPGGCPVVAHPPCRAWGQFSMFAKPREDEKELAPWAVDQVRKWGGVLEHPANSRLWPACGLPVACERDEFGGWTLPIHQHWFGHRAEKRTRLYIVGCEPSDVPRMPLRIDEPTHIIGDVGRAGRGKRPEISKAEREHTPPELAQWLIELARKCAMNKE